MKKIRMVCAVLWLSVMSLSLLAASPPVQLAQVYTDELPVTEYLVSEKLDGIRAIWKDGQFVTKTGKQIFAPDWFTEDLPDVWLDGELWSKRQDFEFIQSTVLSYKPNENHWQNIHYMVFDAPNQKQPFSERARYYKTLLERLGLKHIRPIEQFAIESRGVLLQHLDEYVARGAEGLMLHRKDAMFQDGRSNALVKLKPYMDSEAVVIGYVAGKGRNQDRMGALIVKTQSGIVFKIGSGFTDGERNNPPKVGETITFKYHGLTKNSVPKFASFLRVRKDE
ncbi:DNA ligase [Marinomonas sp. 15G1-11]|uniref:DNA ligase n=1 Tax=Marinomonas phaeophyticola TaxID=3004091 RepID=A0ABT4JYF0_9GAMM|nr:DNA ligase [Marinomonas sp. 15G1-11]MCZ2723430.1 DNA ligase [Marinomonas sp. 15G1-11]